MVSAYSIGTSKRSTEQRNHSRFIPGPGAYDPVKKFKITPPSWRIGTGQRSSLVSKGTPGPGTYQIPQKAAKEGPKYPFGLKTSLKNKEKVPGPGTYEDFYRKTIKNTPFYSFGLRFSSQNRLFSPGPGTYDPNKTSSVIDVPAPRFSRASRNESKERSLSPGVGTYNLGFSPQGPKYGFGTSVRQFLADKKNPGPGTYELSKSLINRAHGATMVSRRTDASFLSQKNLPGPFEYSPEKLASKAAIRFGTSSRDGASRSRSNTPGPGSYHPGFLHKPSSAKYRVGTSLRRPLSANNFAPGPGTYEIPSKMIEGPRLTMSGRTGGRTNSGRLPGPGTYTPDVSFVKERASSPRIGTSMRPNFLLTKNGPGPGQYDIRGGVNGPKWGFGTSLRQNIESGEGIPGPATYNIPPMFADVPKYLMNNASSFYKS